MRALSSSLKPVQWLLLVALLACYPLSYITPAKWAWENSVIENTQVIVLLFGLLSAWFTYAREKPGKIAKLALAVMPIWFILAARELSWGAVFGAPLSFSHEGPVFSSHVLWYKPIVTPVVALLLAWSGFLAWRHRLDQLVLRMAAGGMFPWFAIGIAVFASLGSTCAEGHMQCGLTIITEHAQALEELVELVAYSAVVVAQAVIYRAHAIASRTVNTVGKTAGQH